MEKYRVIKNREPDNSTPINVVVGEVVKCIEESDSNGDWAGWIPT